MILKELKELEAEQMKDVVKLRSWGNSTPLFEPVLHLAEWALKMTQHEIEKITRKK